jgi:hypothetical protein
MSAIAFLGPVMGQVARRACARGSRPFGLRRLFTVARFVIQPFVFRFAATVSLIPAPTGACVPRRLRCAVSPRAYEHFGGRGFSGFSSTGSCVPSSREARFRITCMCQYRKSASFR